MSDLAARSARDVFDDHLRLAQDRDFDADIARNISPTCVFLTGRGAFRGHDGVRRLATMLQEKLPSGRWDYRLRLVEGNTAYLEWSADSGEAYVDDGADSFVIVDGLIVTQTIHYTVRSPGGEILIDWDGSRPDPR